MHGRLPTPQACRHSTRDRHRRVTSTTRLMHGSGINIAWARLLRRRMRRKEARDLWWRKLLSTFLNRNQGPTDALDAPRAQGAHISFKSKPTAARKSKPTAAQKSTLTAASKSMPTAAPNYLPTSVPSRRFPTLTPSVSHPPRPCVCGVTGRDGPQANAKAGKWDHMREHTRHVSLTRTIC